MTGRQLDLALFTTILLVQPSITHIPIQATSCSFSRRCCGIRCQRLYCSLRTQHPQPVWRIHSPRQTFPHLLSPSPCHRRDQGGQAGPAFHPAMLIGPDCSSRVCDLTVLSQPCSCCWPIPCRGRSDLTVPSTAIGSYWTMSS